MTEFPALREALVAAGLRRRRRRRRAGAAVPVLAIGVAAVAVFALPHGSPREHERVARPPADQLEATFAVFRRPQTAADRIPVHVRDTFNRIDEARSRLVARAGDTRILAYPATRIDEARSRLVARAGDTRIFAYPATRPDGSKWLCLGIVRASGSGAGCGPLTSAMREATPIGASTTGAWAQLFPDGTRDVSVVLASGTRLAAPVRNNAVLVTRPDDVAGASWTGPSGVRHVLETEFRIRHVPPPSTCPARLGPLPAGAAELAKRAALIAVDELYPGVVAASVSGAAYPLGTPCAPAYKRRTIEVRLQLVPRSRQARKSASLTQGRLLLGIVDGHMQVYYLIH